MTATNNAIGTENGRVVLGRSPEIDDWIDKCLPLYGHRNWLVIADSAYPAQSRAGITTIAVNGTQESALTQILLALNGSSHVKPLIHTDRELAFVSESDAPGIDKYRAWLAKALDGRAVNAAPHEEIITKLDSAAQTFCVVIFKTSMTIPYTTVFLELDCAYWNADAEQRLRERMAANA